ncbi:MAG: DUF6051 family protein [Bacteroidales bacterium]|jgi:hypothetical protein|nr:DUF6051 family protein [Bacteroidales bacterium]MDD4385607.1 DUF6051 family protein [Bacteroidales bacterium]MDY0196777.1 DUF6051 family protein [Tenuifilaceae bacterium]
MEFTKTFSELKEIFSLDNGNIILENGNGLFRPIPFTSSSNPIPYARNAIYKDANDNNLACDDNKIAENIQFNYLVYLPSSAAKYKKAIVLLHGLNERSWHKYLPWAQYLGQQTNRPIILFPLAFHMNRGHKSWTNPRVMMPLLNYRRSLKGLSMATFANIALSQRLSDDPLRFFTSGKQSAEDLIQLLSSIQRGSVDFLEKGAQVDFFSYSIGSFLAQIMFLANPNNLLSSSKLFIFCGGSLFCDMQGTSRLIMDSLAYLRLHNYFLIDLEEEIKTNVQLTTFIKEGALENAFLTMIRDDYNRDYRTHRFQELQDQMRIISLKRDTVIPSSAIHSNYKCIQNKSKEMVTELDFPFEYSHENTFPILPGAASFEVDKAFNQVFSMAVEFLC